MTRTLSISDTTCPTCKQWYETVEEAIDCEAQDEADFEEELSRAVEEDEYWAQLTEDEETAAELGAYLTSLHNAHF